MNSIPYPLSLNFLKSRLAFLLFYPADYVSNSGRALLEGRSFVYKPSSEDYAVCPYSGSRFQHTKPMNKAALKSTVKNSASIKALLNSYGRSLRLHNQIGNMTLVELWRLAYLGWTLPLFHAHKHPASFLIDDASADLSKFCHGILTLLRALFANNASPSSTWSASQLYEYSEKESLLIGYKEVCAAPSAFIISTLNSMIQQTDNSQWTDQGSDAPISDSIELLHFCQARWLMERASIIYESTRYITLLAFGASAAIKQRHSFPYTLSIAKTLTSDGSKLAEIYSYWFNNKNYRSNDGARDVEGHLKVLIDLSHRIENSTDNYDAADKYWNLFEELMVKIVQRAEILVCANSQEPNIYQYKKNDLSIFFGDNAFQNKSTL